ncbi:outer membrane protein [Methylocella tundrae]|uniref:Autotransporter outer membrane beta-barrel domain-containing protein n=1 Tax=Methylocella tundrae TaxID=227605 RepID=A0A4U8YU29_METTU|nr:outer membrane protein [Methylocella tundrae]WPP04945.1 outer membrane protein [Methylocella tundrae]VFU07226.1 Autotransporter outer membrane beta-barrel domain-containing protein [Methylocella tundrae]
MFKRLLLTTVAAATAGSALAADLPYGQGPSDYAPAVPVFTWSGLYLGGQIGYAWGTSALSAWGPGYSISGVTYNPNGVLGGAHVGYNLQFNQVVLGVEGDVDGTGISKSYGFGPVTYGTQIPVEGTIRGRLGFALDHALFYVAGGAAFASVTNNYQSFLGYNSIGKSVAGWTIGGGVEYALTNNWSVRAEYRYMDLGSSTDYTFVTGPGAGVNHALTTNDVRVGFSYKFDGLLPPSGIAR